MKGLIVLGLIGVVGVGLIFWMMQKSTGDQGISIAVACGNPGDGTVEINAAMDMGIMRREGLRQAVDVPLAVLWPEWVEEHFQLCDAAGKSVRLERVGQSLLINVNRMPGAPDFFLTARLRSGETYSFDYKPWRAKTTKYRHTFVAPADKTEMKRWNFELAEGPGR